MKPSNFDEANTLFKGNGLADLPALRTENAVVSVWGLTQEERIALAEGGRVEITIVTGGGPPQPVAVNVYKVSGFIEREQHEHEK